MSRYDFSSQRIFVDAPLAADTTIALQRDQAHYLLHVLRLANGSELLVFNGRDGEFRAALESQSKRTAALALKDCTRLQTTPVDLDLLFAPLKHARLDYLVQKAVEMGAARLQPVITRRTQAERVNLERMRANVIEAAEQCGVLAVPAVLAPESLEAALSAWSPHRWMVFCDEDAPSRDPVAALGEALAERPDPPLGLIIGPEGGFDPQERALLLALPRVVRLSLGPRILRADTAAVAALALVQAVAGDGRT